MGVEKKLAHFHDLNVDDFIPLLLLAYKLLNATNGTHKHDDDDDDDDDDDHGRRRPKVSHGDIHYYLDVRVDQPAIQLRFETYFAAQIAPMCRHSNASGGD
jgi:hypothetical protein